MLAASLPLGCRRCSERADRVSSNNGDNAAPPYPSSPARWRTATRSSAQVLALASTPESATALPDDCAVVAVRCTHIAVHNDARDVVEARTVRPQCAPDSAGPPWRIRPCRRPPVSAPPCGRSGEFVDAARIPCPDAERKAMPAVQPLHLPRDEPRPDRLGARVHGLRLNAAVLP